jgi:signal transduction histidine kinase
LRGQVAAILLLGLMLSQLIAAVLYFGLIPRWERIQRPESAISGIAMVSRMLEAVAPQERAAMAQLASTANFKFSYEPAAPSGPAPPIDGQADRNLRKRLAAELNKAIDDVRVEHWAAGGEPDVKRVQIALANEGSLDIVAAIGLEYRLGLVEEIGIAVSAVFATAAIWAWLTWSVNAPLSQVATAAEQVGVNIQSPPLKEQGPAQLRRVIRALNGMQQRLQRFLLDRNSMLGAISHELRTPLTRLRLRIETNRMVDEKSKMLQDIEAMEHMLNSTVSFVRGVDDAEPQEDVDLALLVQTACDTVADLGGEVPPPLTVACRYRCKPHALLRALTNVIANAVRHGGAAHVSLKTDTAAGIQIDVQDEGQGIADSEKEKVFEPFYRSIRSRTVHRQGMGLGLPIARSVVLGHGGSIELLDRSPHGLTVRIVLPRASIF